MKDHKPKSSPEQAAHVAAWDSKFFTDTLAQAFQEIASLGGTIVDVKYQTTAALSTVGEGPKVHYSALIIFRAKPE